MSWTPQYNDIHNIISLVGVGEKDELTEVESKVVVIRVVGERGLERHLPKSVSQQESVPPKAL